MQIIIDIKKEQDLQVLLPLLERLKIAYKSLPGTKEANEKKTVAAKPTKLSDKYAGKLSKEIGQELQKHVAQSRNEWERKI
ncbi:MAG: hypothetical protein ACKVT2_16620 [Saprospiraceae bacterium]